MKKQTEFGKALNVINTFIGRKLEEAKKIHGTEAKIKFYNCLEEKGFTVNYNRFNGKAVSIFYTPWVGKCEDAWENVKLVKSN